MSSDAASIGTGPIRIERLDGGAIWRVTLTMPKGNVLDRAMVAALRQVAHDARNARDLKAIVIDGDGGNFSFGASVAEHLPAEVAGMLRGFHALFFDILESSVVWIAAVRGRCLGGGLELAAFCHRHVVHADAVLGQPEIVLGVFAPLASVYLHERIGRGAAEDLLLSGRTLSGREAVALRLADELAEDPTEASIAWVRTHLLPKSAASLRFAVRASRLALGRRLREEIDALERFYLDELMSTGDALEGLTAFLEKRPPQWKNR